MNLVFEMGCYFGKPMTSPNLPINSHNDTEKGINSLKNILVYKNSKIVTTYQYSVISSTPFQHTNLEFDCFDFDQFRCRNS